MEAGWYEVDETGHVPGVAAELPLDHRVLLDASGNIGAIVPGENMPAIEQAIAEMPPVEPSPGVESAPDNDAAETPGQGE